MINLFNRVYPAVKLQFSESIMLIIACALTVKHMIKNI